MTTQAERRSTTKNEILRAATKIILEDGYNSCSILAIANASNVTSGAIQHHFKSKSDLLYSVITEHIFTKQPHAVDKAITQRPLEERCRQVIDALWSYYGHENYSVVWEIILGNRHNKTLQNEIERFFSAAEIRAKSDIQKVFADLRLTSEQANEICLFITAQLRGTSLIHFKDPKNTMIARQPNYLAELLSLKLQQISAQLTE